jgi:hypothetical protein
MKLIVGIPSILTKKMYTLNQDRSPAVFMLDALRYYIDAIETGQISKREQGTNEGNKDAVRLD